jgi:uncharacterized protein involved in exopolysaccharide biosynthesis/Mrp family chromosome partitioning ATPase
MDSGFDSDLVREDRSSEIDIRTLWVILVRKRAFILLPTCVALILAWLIVSFVTSRYTAESQVILENQENFFTRPQKDQVLNDGMSLVDAEAVGSQIQLVTSRDLARRAIKALNLEGNPEFDPLAKGIGPVSRVLNLLGLIRDPASLSPEERILQTFQERLSVYSPTKTRVLTIDFQSRDPELAARAANKIAELYLAEQSDAKRARAKAAASSLESLIVELRGKLTDASAQVEEFRSRSGLLAGTNNMTITGQQLAELNTELSRARTSQADAQAKAALIRDMIKQGHINNVPDVANNELVRRIAEQRITARAQLASDSRTLLPGHPHIQELTAQVADLDIALRAAAEQTIKALENEAKVASNRVANLESVLDQQKKMAGVANVDEVHLRELERIADAYKDQLDSSTTKYQEALAREDSPATPADARIISRAAVPTEPSYPKKLPLVVFATLATFLGTSGWIVASELLSGRAIAKPSGSRAEALPRGAVAPRVFTRAAAIEPSLGEAPPEKISEDGHERGAFTAASLAAFITANATGKRSTCIVTSGIKREDLGSGLEVALARDLAELSHAIILDLDGHSDNFAPFFSGLQDESAVKEHLTGLTDLLEGEASFAEVIRRDEISRLHFIPAGRLDSFDMDGFVLILEALSQTYDFILLMAPPFEGDETAFFLAAYADFVIVSEGAAEEDVTADIKRDLLEAGAQDVIIVKKNPAAAPLKQEDVA